MKKFHPGKWIFIIYLFLSFLLIGQGIEIVGLHLLEQVPKEKRNPFFKRGWVKHSYEVEPKKEGEFLIILISNSQGYGAEVNDEESYALLFEKMMTEQLQSPVRVLNWSIQGGAGVDMVIQAAAANRLQPDLLLVVASADSFKKRYLQVNPEGNRVWASDNYLLLAYPDVAENIPESFISRFFASTDFLELKMAAFWPLWNLRALPIDWLIRGSRFLDKERDQIWFLQPNARIQNSSNPKEAEEIGWEIVAEFLETTRTIKGRRVYIEMPTHSFYKRGRAEKTILLHKEFQNQGFETWDLSGSVKDENLLGLTHLNKRGNMDFAEKLMGKYKKYR